MPPLSVGQHRRRHRQGDLPNQPGDGLLARGELAHGRQHRRAAAFAAGGGQRHHPMRQGKRRLAIADPSLRLVGDLGPAIADIYSVAMQPKQHRRGVLHVDVEIGGQSRSAATPDRGTRRRRATALWRNRRAPGDTSPGATTDGVSGCWRRPSCDCRASTQAIPSGRRPVISSTWATPCAAHRSARSRRTASRPAVSASR